MEHSGSWTIGHRRFLCRLTFALCLAGMIFCMLTFPASAKDVTVRVTTEDNRLIAAPRDFRLQKGDTITFQNDSERSFFVWASTYTICGSDGTCTDEIAPGQEATFAIPMDARVIPENVYCSPTCGPVTIDPGVYGYDGEPGTTEAGDAIPVAAAAGAQEETLHRGASLPASGPKETAGMLLVGALLLFPIAYKILVRA